MKQNKWCEEIKDKTTWGKYRRDAPEPGFLDIYSGC
jgi:hypothetical protein